MKLNVKVLVASLAVLCVASFALAKDKGPKPGPLTGTWECTSHGGSQGDMPITLYLEQNRDIITGSVASPMGGTQITSGSFKRNVLEIQIDTPQGAYHIKAKLKKGQLTGEWSSETEKGTWEARKQAPASK
jgi:hypothetical protein